MTYSTAHAPGMMLRTTLTFAAIACWALVFVMVWQQL